MKREENQLYALVEMIRADAFPLNELNRMDGVVALIRQHKLCSYVFSHRQPKENCFWLDELGNEQKERHILSEQTRVLLLKAARKADIKIFIIKGLSFEKCIYGNGCSRDVGDIDVLVDPNDSLKFHDILYAMGYRQRIGPSSTGAKSDRALAAICATQGSLSDCLSPVKRHPYKTEFSPYVKIGCPTIEVHDGFYRLPTALINCFLETTEIKQDSFLLDPLCNLFLLIANTYENSESFYSNAFDHGAILRDYVDLHFFFKRYDALLDWGQVRVLLDRFNLAPLAAAVLKNYSRIYGNEALGANFKKVVQSYESPLHGDILERMGDDMVARQCAYRVFRQHLDEKSFGRSMVPSLDIAARHDRPFPLKAVLFQIAKGADKLVAVWEVPQKYVNDSFLYQVCLYPIDDEASFLALKVDLGVFDGVIRAYARKTNRFLCGAAVKKNTNMELPIELNSKREIICVTIEIGYGLLDYRYSDTVISAQVYKQNYENVYKALPGVETSLFEDVIVGRIARLTHQGACITIPMIGWCFTIYSDDDAVTRRLRAIFTATCDGWMFYIASRHQREYSLVHLDDGLFSIAVDNSLPVCGMSLPEATQIIMQDMSDCLCDQVGRSCYVAHAAAISFGSNAVLFMGKSGSGKTSLAIACSNVNLLLGDECVFVDVSTRKAWCEDFPFQIKERNVDILNSLDRSLALEVCGGLHGRAFYFPRTAVNADPNPTTPKVIQSIFFPRYDASYTETIIDDLPKGELVQNVLGSFMGDERPSSAFGAFAHMVSVGGIEVKTIRYSNVADAARLLQDHLCGAGRQ